MFLLVRLNHLFRFDILIKVDSYDPNVFRYWIRVIKYIWLLLSYEDWLFWEYIRFGLIEAYYK